MTLLHASEIERLGLELLSDSDNTHPSGMIPIESGDDVFHPEGSQDSFGLVIQICAKG